jgi:hypothetical protein
MWRSINFTQEEDEEELWNKDILLKPIAQGLFASVHTKDLLTIR